MNVPDVIPQVELAGSPIEKLTAINALIVRLEAMRATLAGEMPVPAPASELHGPYINAPVWPWFLAGCAVGAIFVLLFVVAWLYA